MPSNVQKAALGVIFILIIIEVSYYYRFQVKNDPPYPNFIALDAATTTTNTSDDKKWTQIPAVLDTDTGTTTSTNQSHSSSTNQSHSSTGFVLAMDYWEQMTKGSANLQSLQCWAAQFNLSVVEPMVAGSQYLAPFTDPHSSTSNLKNLLLTDRFWFHDLVDMDMWNQLSAKLFHSLLVPWDYFINNAPRSVILVSFKYGRNQKLAIRYPSPSQQSQQGCPTVYWDSVSDFLNRHNFNVVRRACFNYNYGEWPDMRLFNAHIFGGHSPHSVTVIFGQWRGQARVFRNAKCVSTDVSVSVGPSQELLQVAAEYKQKYLQSRPYLAVMARLEKINMALMKRPKTQSLQGCYSKLLEAWKAVQKESGLNTTFLAADMGRFGSNTFSHAKNHEEVKRKFENDFFKAVYGPEFSVENWEDSFQTVANTTDAGYIGQLQGVLVAHAECIVFIGGGFLQMRFKSLYLQAHPQKQDQCVRTIPECNL